MTKIPTWLMLIVPGVLAVLGSGAISAQDKYSVEVPDGLAFSEFRGYENWQLIAVSQTGDLLVAILENPEIIADLAAGSTAATGRSRRLWGDPCRPASARRDHRQ